MNRHRKIRVSVPFAGLVLAAALAGCSQVETDPFLRTGIWKPSGVNDANIAAQVANPADLARGRSDGTGTMRTATRAVDRLWQGSPAPGGSGQQGGANPFQPRQGSPGEAPR